jgi:hypothetical protein
MAVIKIVPMPGAVGDKGDPGETGPQGPQGQTGQTGQNGQDALWSYQGAWQSNAAYAVGDLVTYEGQLYYAKAITTTGTLPTDTSKFDLIAAKGTNGTNGADGADGSTPFTLVGAYDNGASYNLGVAVYYNGGTYVRTGNPLNPGYPPTLGAINESWTPVAEKGDVGSQLNYWDGASVPQDPAEDGFLIVDGIVTGPGSNILVSADDRVFIGGNNGEFLNGLSTPENQIATIGDIQEVDTLTNGLVVTGQIDDETINPAGTMSLSVQDGYTALMDLIAHSATFNGDIQVTNLSGTRNTTIDTPVTINNDLTINGSLNVSTGATGSFTIGKQTFNITNGIITSIDVNIQA